ncbi:MAG: hypothetical protein ACI8SA_002458, partial [Dokdonia sp.]
ATFLVLHCFNYVIKKNRLLLITPFFLPDTRSFSHANIKLKKERLSLPFLVIIIFLIYTSIESPSKVNVSEIRNKNLCTRMAKLPLSLSTT